MKLLLSLLLLSVIFVSGCLPQSSGSRGIEVVGSNDVVADLARVILGELPNATVVSLFPTGSDPHLNQISGESKANIARADVILLSGTESESLADVIYEARSPESFVLDVVSAIPTDELLPLANSEDLTDAHVWGDPRLWEQCIDVVLAALGDKLPDHRGTLERNAEAYRQELVDLHHWATLRTSQLPEAKRTLITSHESFRYFGKAYGIAVFGIHSSSNQADPDPSRVAELSQLINEKKVFAIFPEFGLKPDAIRALAGSSGTTVAPALYSGSLADPEGTQSLGSEVYGVGTYLGAFRYNVDVLVEALK